MKSHERICMIVNLFICFLFSLVAAVSRAGEDSTPSVDLGVKVFHERCALCHGSDGMGEGRLPLKLRRYPNTNLLTPKHPLDSESVRNIVVLGGVRNNVSNLMPPMGDDLTWTELESVVKFVIFMRKEPQVAAKMLSSVQSMQSVSLRVGQEIFSSRCKLCHGQFGEGDGRMAKVITSPPPSDLSASRLPDEYMREIISKGGAGVNRSQAMPPWGKQFTKVEIDSLILYLKDIRD